MNSISQKIQRSDDLFKLSVIILTISLSYGTTFFRDLGVSFFAGIFVAFMMVLIFWGVGHLYGERDLEVFLKLMAWWSYFQVTPAILLNYIVPRTSQEIYSPTISLPILLVGLLAYFALYRYLREGLTKWSRKVAFYFPIVFLCGISLYRLIFWMIFKE